MASGPTGKLGLVVHRVRGGDLPGEVRVVHDGVSHDYLAYSPGPIDRGVQVLVVHDRGARQVDVEPWLLPGLGDAVAAGGPGRL
jgi:hypothetical protein